MQLDRSVDILDRRCDWQFPRLLCMERNVRVRIKHILDVRVCEDELSKMPVLHVDKQRRRMGQAVRETWRPPGQTSDCS